MAVGWGPQGSGGALDALGAGWRWVKLHKTAEPGAAGTTNPATETIRKQATFGATGTDGIMTNTGALTWTNIAGSEDALYFTTWSADHPDTTSFGASGTITANAYVAGDTYEVAIAALSVSVTLAS
jgi:hypothetical protein